MVDEVTSGLGRNGPWLQNRWLRVETRQDDGSMSPVALDGAFRPTERALAMVRLADGGAPSFARFDYDVRGYEDALGSGRLLTLTARDPRAGLVLEREIVLFESLPFLVTRTGVRSERADAVRLASLHPFVSGEGRSRLQLKSPPADWRIYRHGWQSWSPTMALAGSSADLRSAPPVLSSEPPAAGAGRFASDDVGLLYDPASGRSMLTGAVTARDALTQVVIDTAARGIDARCYFDGISLASGETVWSERVVVDLTGTPQEQLARYGNALAKLMGARIPEHAPAGWCSWYYFYQGVSEDDVLRNLRFLEQHRDQLPIQTVQIDDGYQADIGDWLLVNEKFPHGMRWLASEIRAAGYTPGIWTAPLLVSESSRAFQEHPEFVVRDESGEPALAMDNWLRRNYAIDGSHPGAREWLQRLFGEITEDWGYDYLKIDFLFAAAIAGVRHDPAATRARAYRAALDAVRAGAGHSRFILGCGSLMAPSVGYFDGNRIGLDVAPFWRFLTTEERARPRPRPRAPDDNLSAEGAVRNTLNRWWMHGRLWANDPDCLLVRTDRTKLTLDEVRTLTAVIGLSGGMMLSSDDLPGVPPERLELIEMLLPPLSRSAVPVDLMERDMPERFVFESVRDVGPALIAAVFNFEDEARDLALPLAAGRWHAVELWSERYLGTRDGTLDFPLVEPHGSRVVALTPASQGMSAAVIASTGHIGMGASDIESSSYDPGARVLTVTLNRGGRRRRRIFFATGGQSPERAEAGGETLSIGGDGAVRYIDITMSGGPMTVAIQFAVHGA